MTGRNQLVVAGLIVVVVASLAAAGRYFLSDELEPIGLGAKAPDFVAMTLDSIPKKKTLDDYKGQVVLINIWATWCGPCRVEMPSIEKLNAAYAPKGLKVIAISVDDPGYDTAIREFAKEYHLTFEVLHDPGGQDGRITRDYQTSGYPETVIIGRDGIIRRKFLGATNWNSPSNRSLIERLLAERVS